MPSTMPSVPSAPTGTFMNQLMFDTRSRLPRPWRAPAARKLSTQACWWRGVVAVAQRVRLPAAGPADRVVVGARAWRRSSSSGVPSLERSDGAGDEEDVALGGDRVGRRVALGGVVRRRRAGSRRPGCPRGRRCAASGPAGTTPDHAARAATTSSSDDAHRAPPGQEVVGVLEGPLPLGRRRPQRVVGPGARRRHAVQPHRSTTCTSGRSSSGWGTLATQHDDVHLGPQLDRRCRAAGRRRGRSDAVVADDRPLEQVDARRQVAASEPVLGGGDGEQLADASASALWMPLVAVAGRRRRAALVAPHRASWRALVSATIVISTRPMSDSSSAPRPR